MPWSVSNVADTQYDNTHSWDSLFNGGPSADVWRPDPVQQKMIAQAQMMADMSTPNGLIRANMTAGSPWAPGSRPRPVHN